MNSPLFEPCRFAGLDLKNRIAMAPMTRSRAVADGMPTELMAEYYEQRAEAGLIVSEGTNISLQGQGFTNTPGIFNETQVHGWRNVADRVHAAGSRIFMQLWHVGRVSHPDNMAPGLHPVGPSAIAPGRDVVTPTGPQRVPQPRAMTSVEVRDTIDDYARAARLAVRAGFDGVEIHAANGYLPSQFLHETTNHRTDEFGGSLERRARFVVDITRACAEAVGGEKVAIRFTPFSVFNAATSSDEPALYAYILERLAPLGIAYVHVVAAEISGNTTIEAGVAELPDAVGFVRGLWSGEVIACGNYDLARADSDIRERRATMISFGRDFIGNPDLVTRLRDGLPLVVREPSAWYGGGRPGYTDFARHGSAEHAR